MRRPSRNGLSLAFACLASVPLIAQDLHSIGAEKPFSFSGGISINQVFHASNGTAFRRDPYRYYASANVNLSLYGWSIPLGFNVTNASATFSQPFNRYALHPTWKWITAHAGYTSMSFSPYTVNGHLFLGGGIELSPPGKWKVSALYGRFLKAVEADTLQAPERTPAFQRKGYALKVSYGPGRDALDLVLFRAADDAHSIAPLPDSLDITPQQNLVASIGGGKTLFKHFFLKAEIAVSALTKDSRAERTDSNHPLAQPGLFVPRVSSVYHQALKASFDYQHQAWLLGIAYERVDPEYRTLGAYYFNNDLENITLNGSAGLLQGKMNIAASAGMQRDNLDHARLSSMRRMAGSFNMAYTPSARLNVSASWSSFRTYTNLRPGFESINQLTPLANPDTLNFTQLSRNATLSAMYALQDSEKGRQNITLNLTWQDATDRQAQANAGTAFTNFSAGYSRTLIPANMNLAITFNAALSEADHFRTNTLGPTLSVSRTCCNRKFRTSFSSAWTDTFTRGNRINRVINARVTTVITLRKQHNISISAVGVNRAGARQTARSVAEFTGTAGYRYNFGRK